MIKAEVVHSKVTSVSGLTSKLHARLYTAIVRLSIELQAYIKGSKLSGQVLRNRTGTLRRSINWRVVDTPTSIRGYVGTNVKYAKPHEYGFQGPVQVKEHLRTIKQAWGKPISETTFPVRSHTRQVNIPERSFLRSALRDKRDHIIAKLEKALYEGST